MKQFVSQIWKSAAFRNVGKLLSANVIAQAIGLLIYPLLTRIYAPEDFALFNLFNSIVGVLVIIATAEYQYAIVLPEDEKKAVSIVHVCLLILAAITFLITLSIPFSKPIACLFNAAELSRFWWLIPFSVLGLSLWNILNYWYIRHKAFTRISGYQITQSIFSATSKIGLGALCRLNGGLIIATIIAQLLSLLISICLSWKKHLRELFTINWSQLKSVTHEYANFPKFNLPRTLVNSIGIALPVWLLTPHFGLASVGQLSLAMMAAVLPFSLFARACYQVLFQQVSEKVQQHLKIGHILNRFIVVSGGAIVGLLLIVYFFLPQMVTLFFGEQWSESAGIIRALYPYLLLTPVCGTICFLSDVFGKQKIAMWLETGYVIFLAAALGIGIYLGSFIGAVRLFAWMRLIYLTIQLFWFLSLARKYDRSL